MMKKIKEQIIDVITELFNKLTAKNNCDRKNEVSDWTDVLREDTPATKIREFIDRTNQIYDDSKLSIGFVSDINSYLVYSDNEIVASINADRRVSFLCKKYNVELIYLLNLIDFSGEFL